MKLMSNTERRLRRLAGQIRQLHLANCMGDLKLRRNIGANLDWACLHYDHVMPHDITDLRILKYAEDLADDIANHDRTRRIEVHVEKMSGDLAAAQRWVNNAEDVDAWQDGEKVHPQDRVVELSNKWKKWWETEPASPSQIRGLLGNVTTVKECPAPEVKGLALWKMFRASNGKAAGADAFATIYACPTTSRVPR